MITGVLFHNYLKYPEKFEEGFSFIRKTFQNEIQFVSELLRNYEIPKDLPISEKMKIRAIKHNFKLLTGEVKEFDNTFHMAGYSIANDVYFSVNQKKAIIDSLKNLNINYPIESLFDSEAGVYLLELLEFNNYENGESNNLSYYDFIPIFHQNLIFKFESNELEESIELNIFEQMFIADSIHLSDLNREEIEEIYNKLNIDVKAISNGNIINYFFK